LRELNLYVPAGQKLGIAGPFGAGKSTLINLMQRLYDVQGGAVLIDGYNVESVTRVSWTTFVSAGRTRAMRK
jgi:ATP-binding cassette subfamily B protein